MLGDLAVLVAAALVAELLADRALEEDLAALAADGAVVPAWNKTKKRTLVSFPVWRSGEFLAGVKRENFPERIFRWSFLSLKIAAS